MKMLNLIPVKWSINSKSLNLVPVYNSNLKVSKITKIVILISVHQTLFAKYSYSNICTSNIVCYYK